MKKTKKILYNPANKFSISNSIWKTRKMLNYVCARIFLKETKNPHYGGANDMRLLKLLCQKHGQWTCDKSFFQKYMIFH